MKSIWFFWLGLLSFLFFGCNSKEKPNIIIILTDDQGYGDTGFNGCKDISTPNMDRIAENGVVFTDAYVAFPICAPSRAGLLTGRYPYRFGFERNPLVAPKDTLQGLPLSESTLADMLSGVGYTSKAIGKWHLGTHESQHPLKRGFDEFFGFLGGGHNYFPEEWILNDEREIKNEYDSYKTRLMRDYGRVYEDEYITDAFTREALEFIEQEAGSPFFLYLAYNAPHGPLQATDRYLERCNNIDDNKRKTYAAMLTAVDDGIGMILDKLEELKINENTLIFFLSDNGGPEKVNGSDNGILREGKSSLYEGGIRVPFAMQWPGRIPSGIIYQKPIISLDIFATLTECTGAAPDKNLDGVNLIPYLTRAKQKGPHNTLYWRKYDAQGYAVRDNDFKLIKFHSPVEEGYKLTTDPGEHKPLEKKDVKSYRRLSKLFRHWESELRLPVFLGLTQEKEYNATHPDRFDMVSPYLPANGSPHVPEGYQLLWSDEFNTGDKPDESFWSFEEGFIRNRELQWYTKENCTVRDGMLVIHGKKETTLNPNYVDGEKNWKMNRRTAEYSSSSINTANKFSFRYGILEVRARIDTASGMWPAIWTLGINGGWPSNGEIDLMEFYRIDEIPNILANAAWADKDNIPVWESTKIPFSIFTEKELDWAEKFHTWKMDWTENYIKLYLDNQLLNDIDLSNTINPDGFNPFHQEHYILLNLAIGGRGGDLSKTSFPSKYEVDYVRVYQKQ